MSKQKTNEGLFGAAKKFTDSFFDGLKSNATNKALNKVKNNKQVPPPIIQRMIDIDKLAKQLEADLKKYT
jgi:hypothetical protein|tara:strand:+ start:76 stop:285 length:210 start_codon:yes stop_codon:yes gene_type:complete